jgi:uncharacterized protein YuzE
MSNHSVLLWSILPLASSFSDGEGGYLPLIKAVIEYTIELIPGILYVDLNKNGDVIGYEILHTEKYLVNIEWMVDGKTYFDYNEQPTEWIDTDDPKWKVMLTNNDGIIGIQKV